MVGVTGTDARIGRLDTGLALLAWAAVEYWLIQRADYWFWAPDWLAVFVAWTPLLIAIRRIDPALALGGLLAGTYVVSLLSGGIAWPLVAGCLLAVWVLPTRWGTGTGLVLTAVLAAAPVLVDLKRGLLNVKVYPWLYSRITLPDGSTETNGGLSKAAYDRLEAVHWPWWLSVGIVLYAVAVMVLRRRQGVVAQRRSPGRWVEDLLAAARPQSGAGPVLVLTAAAVVPLAMVELAADRQSGNWWSAPGWMPYVLAFAPLTLAVRRRWPAVPVAVIGLAALISYWQTDIVWSLMLALALALFSLGTAPRSLAWSVPLALVVLAALPTIAELIRYRQMILLFPTVGRQPFDLDPDGRLRNTIYDEMVDRQWPVSLSLILLVPLCAGIAVRLYRRNRAAARREKELEREAGEREAEQVVLTERSIIARDLHDIVAHAVNLMVIQAETGPDLVRRGEDDVLAGFQRIGDAGRRALGELDRLLSALRDADGVPDPQLTPQPGLAELRQLVADVTSEQLPIELELSGDVSAPPEGQQLTAYRLVQEALTNAVRHAKATGVQVTVNVGVQWIAVEIVDDGVGFDPDAVGSRGRHGLAGMRERVRVHHGSLEIDSTPGAGTRITAWIPESAS
ncbi:sensor histidine kinase [Kribbella soli]|uniref:histidine kinase n=1 Tax=Kribbella soli TaxID=1124743 RepID=A0A4R0HNA0_9ACTN|nr:sensor histidine kinase [Kribbella soli]